MIPGDSKKTQLASARTPIRRISLVDRGAARGWSRESPPRCTASGGPKLEAMNKKSDLPPRITGAILLRRKSAKGRRFGGNVDFLTADVRMALHLPPHPKPEPWTDEDVAQMRNFNPDQACEEQEREIFNETTFEHEVGNSIWWGVREYIIACIDNVDLKQFRRGAASVEKAINKVLALLRYNPPNQTPGAINRARPLLLFL
jgi:hypothetical protein